MKDITYNVKNDATILSSLNDFEPWALFDRLGKSIADGYGVTSPQIARVTEMPQISTETSETVNVLVEGEKTAETYENEPRPAQTKSRRDILAQADHYSGLLR